MGLIFRVGLGPPGLQGGRKESGPLGLRTAKLILPGFRV